MAVTVTAAQGWVVSRLETVTDTFLWVWVLLPMRSRRAGRRWQAQQRRLAGEGC